MRSLAAVLTRSFRLGLGVHLALMSLVATASAQDATRQGRPDRRLGADDVLRIRELHHITDTFGAEIWPGFDTRKIPVAINNDDLEELLIGHADPPQEFRPFKEFRLQGQPVMIREGVTRYGPKGGGWAVDLGGQHTAYVSTLGRGQSTETYLSLILHECFHCFQKDFWQRSKDAYGNLSEDDPIYSAMIGLESRILKAALAEQDDEQARELAKTFVAVRHKRRQGMPPNLVLLEGEHEFNEGTATYTQARMYQLIASKGITPLDQDKDPRFDGFPNARRDYARMISEIIPFKGLPITFFHSMYKNGMAQCLILDRVRPGWKDEMREHRLTQFALLEKEFPLGEDQEKELLSKARDRFGYAELLGEQKNLIEKRLDLIRGYIDAPGRLYRIHYRNMRQGFNWKPVGPVYHVPESLERALAEKRKAQGKSRSDGHAKVADKNPMRRSVWVGGIRRFEMEGLDFASQETPVMFGRDHIEWIDLEPASDRSDMIVESEREQDGTYWGLKVKTDGFILEADKARIDWSKDVVEIYPLPR